jgi:hypothetical protein
MFKRTLAICLMVLLAASILLPFADSNAHGFRQNSQVGHRRSHRYRSRAWWRRYRARLRKKRAAAAALAHRNALLTLPQNLSVGDYITIPKASTNPTVATSAVNPTAVAISKPVATAAVKPTVSTVAANPTVAPLALATRPRTVTLPKTSLINKATLPTTAVLTSSTTKLPTLTNTPFPVAPAPAPAVSNARTDSNHIGNEAIVRSMNPVTPLPGQLSISVVALARPNPAFLTTREENKLLAGINVADLRRIVIDKMVVAGGWVINDYVREINGARVFVVTARTPKDASTPAKVWTFFFTESGGRIYSLTADSPVEHADRMSKEAERFLGSLQSATPAEPKK